MWPMIAEPGLRCAECRHTIQPGRLCLSELPEETPAGVQRSDFKNYCIGCPECWRQGKHACYVRHLNSGSSTSQTPRSLPCARCGQRIGAGEKAAVDTYYEWPGEAEDGLGKGLTSAGATTIGTVTTAAGVDTLIRGVPSGSFADLSDSLQQKFQRAGGIDYRTAPEAQSFYQDSIPHSVRNLGGDAVKKFLGLDEEGKYIQGTSKDASHIQAKANAPHLEASDHNLLWENSDINQARGAENMGGLEQFRAHATNVFDASTILFRECLTGAATFALYAALFEAPVAAVENCIHYHKGHKTGEEAIKDVAKAIAIRATTGAVVGFAVTGAVSLLGAGPLLVTIAPVLVPVGLALYAFTALKRILNALKDGLPLHQVGTYFCSPRCHTTFAYETGRSALMRWEEIRGPATAKA